MYTGLAISMGVCGLVFMPLAILLIKGKGKTTLGIFRGMCKDAEAAINKKAYCRFLGIVYLVVAIICFLGMAFALSELLPIPILTILNLAPVMSVSSFSYLNRSKRFRYTE